MLASMPRNILRLPLLLGLLLPSLALGTDAAAQSAAHAAGAAAPESAAPSALSPSVLNIDGLGKSTAAIDGPWQFHIGDNPAWAQPQTPDATGSNGWEQITADDTWGAQGHPSYAGFAWYRKHLHLTPAAGTDPNFALLIPQIDDAYEIYWNGQLVGRLGTLAPHRSYINAPAKQIFGLGAARDGVLAVRVWKAPLASNDPAELGGLNAPPLVGSPEAIAAVKAQDDYAWMRGRQFQFGLWLLYVLVAAMGWLTWLRNREQYALLALAVYCASSIATNMLPNLQLPIPANPIWAVQQPLYGLQYTSLWYLLLYLFHLDRAPKVARFTRNLTIAELSFVSLDGVLNLFDWSRPFFVGWAQALDGVLTVAFIIVQLYPFVLIYFALRRRLDASRWLLAIAAALVGLEAHVISALQQGQRFTHWTLAEKLRQPLFTLNGNRFTPRTICDLLLFAAIVYAIYRTVRETAHRQSSLEREFQSARELQQVLIPEIMPRLPGYAVASAYRPAQEVGGDFFQIIPLEGHFAGSTLVVIGDVSGKGLKAAMTVALIVGAMRTLAKVTYKPGEILSGLNSQLYGRLAGGFVTCLIMRLSASGSCTVASAGHPAPVLNDREIEIDGALPLGIVPEAQYREEAFGLREGDHLALYTDGLLEARDANGELFSFARLKEIFAARTDAAQAAEAAVANGQDDDITVLTVLRLASGEESSTRIHTRALPVAAR
jgi:serine phosphatase RsbU (regulator of sigma subunit)